MRKMLTIVATEKAANEKADSLRAGGHPREIVVTPADNGSWTVAEERCPSCDHDLAAPGLNGHVCYTYAQWHANQAKNRAAAAMLSVGDRVTFPITAGHRRTAASSSPGGNLPVVVRAVAGKQHASGQITRVQDTVVTVQVLAEVFFDVAAGDVVAWRENHAEPGDFVTLRPSEAGITHGRCGSRTVPFDGVELVTAQVIDVRSDDYIVSVPHLAGFRDVSFTVALNAPTLTLGDADDWFARRRATEDVTA